MEIIQVTEKNIEKEHICCAISGNDDCQVKSKKDWLRKEFRDGLVFKKGDVRGKCFIEYIPAENAWAPIQAEGYMYIDCLWVSGQFKGHGYSNQLLAECMKDAKDQGKKGVVILSAKKKLPFMSDPKYLKHKGFKACDTANPQYVLYYYPFDENETVIPKFKPNVKNPYIEDHGFVIFYTNQCPFTAKYVPILEAAAKEHQIPIRVCHIESKKMAQDAPAPSTTFCLFFEGKFITNEMMSENKFLKLAEELMGQTE